MNLASSAITSFATQAKIAGDISLNACSSLTSVDISSTQFQNTTSKIHVHATDDESDTNVVSGLNDGTNTTILLPAPVNNVSFDKTRIHPNIPLEDNMAEAATSGSFEDDCEPKCRIDYNADTKVATVYAYTAGHFKALMEKDNNYSKFANGTIFKFDASCVLNADDLAALAGDATNNNYNKFYVDLYDLPASYDDTKNEETTTKGVITQAIDIMRTNNWQYKGLLLPKAAQNIGTTLIQDRTEDQTKVATCSESIAYSGNIPTTTTRLTASYIYKAADDYGIDYQARLLNLEKMMDQHEEIVNTTQYYSVSSNSATPLDLSTLPTTATVEGSTVNTSKLETVNNNMVTGTDTPSIYAYPAYEGVMKNVMDNTGIGATPGLDLLKVDGPLTATDIASVNKFTSGPRVLDLSQANVEGGITKAMLESITNANIEYIILPEGMTKDVVCDAAYSSSMKKLKAVISSSSTDLVAYVKEAGSLAEARYLTTGGSFDGTLFSPTQTGLQSVTLAGSLNASDIAANTTTHFTDASGNWKTASGNVTSTALLGEQGTITKIDLEKAVFATQTDMNFSYAGLGSISDITLPTSSSMTLIPENCFNGITSFDDLCIPYNYKKIDNQALFGSYCSHITTTDANGAVIDNGALTYTFSKNLEEIGTKPAAKDAYGVYSLSETVFPQNRGVTDVYVLAHKVPKCYANAFPANMLYGWGGFKGGDFPYCREKYDNSADGSLIFTVLHFPDKASFNASSDKEDSYEQMKKYYTDVNKIYTKKEQTGAVDANGDPIAWPTFAELRRAYNQATSGDQWYDWNISYDGQNSINGGNYIPVGTGEYTRVATGTDPNTTEKDYDFVGYEGWHQFSLSMATYVAPDKTTTQNNYVQAGWYTLCIPFSLTEEQLIAILGVPRSTDSEKSYVDGVEQTGTDLLPDLRTLRSVTRTPGTTNKVTLMFTNDLTQTVSGDYQYWNINDTNPNGSAYGGNGALTGGQKIAVRGGYPYLVKPYLPEGVIVTNLGEYIMTRFSKMFTTEQSCLNRDGCYEDLVAYDGTNKTGRFAKPYENHKIQAYLDVSPGGGYTTHSGTDKDKKYYYTFVGQFWDQKLPLYSFYMVENNTNAGKWYWYHSGNKNYTWAAYKCVIMVTPEVDDTKDHPNSGKYRDPNIVYPTSSGIDAQKGYIFDKEFKLVFRDGLDDMADFNSNARMHIFTLDNFEFEFEDDNTTSIEQLDGVDIIPANSKVYNMNGQLVGNSLEGLSKGMYIVNGKKYIVK